MPIKVRQINQMQGRDINMQCPFCSHRQVPIKIGHDYAIDNGYWTGIRYCLNPDCIKIFFILYNPSSLAIYYCLPPHTISFEQNNIPDKILKSFYEAISCHSISAFSASGIMIRRVLEEICEDKGAKGNDLHTRLLELKKIIILPEALLEGMIELKILGNDAAHVESKHYTNISKNEIEIALDITKEILKGVYQLNDMVERLKSLKK
jgi:hypothetical protein